jgi:hypothetical protein
MLSLGRVGLGFGCSPLLSHGIRASLTSSCPFPIYSHTIQLPSHQQNYVPLLPQTISPSLPSLNARTFLSSSSRPLTSQGISSSSLPRPYVRFDQPQWSSFRPSPFIVNSSLMNSIQKRSNQTAPPPSIQNFGIFLGVALFAFLFYSLSRPQEVPLPKFLDEILPNREIESIYIGKGYAKINPKDSFQSFNVSIGSGEFFEKKVEEIQIAKGVESHNFIPIYYTDTTPSIFFYLLPFIIYFGIGFFALKKMNMPNPFSVTNSPAVLFNPQNAKIKFDQVAGLDEAKVEIMEFVSFLKRPQDFKKLGAKIPRGALLVGPPGTG